MHMGCLLINKMLIIGHWWNLIFRISCQLLKKGFQKPLYYQPLEIMMSSIIIKHQIPLLKLLIIRIFMNYGFYRFLPIWLIQKSMMFKHQWLMADTIDSIYQILCLIFHSTASTWMKIIRKILVLLPISWLG